MDFLRALFVGDGTAIAYITSILISLCVAAHYYYDNQYRYFEKLGLKTPRAVAPLGNAWTIFFCNRLKSELEWVRQCGKFYGIYLGREPRFVVADAELLRQICIKDFHIFPNHEKSQFLNVYQRRFIFFTQDQQWKRMRALQAPTFTSGKIKRMFKLLDRCADDMVQCFREQIEAKAGAERHEQAVLNVKDIYALFTMDGIASCGYGLKLERASGAASIKSVASRDAFVTAAMRLFEFKLTRLAIMLCVPKKLLERLDYHMVHADSLQPLVERVRRIVATRKQHLAEHRKFDDYLQILLDAKLNDKMELDEMDEREHHHAGLTDESLLSDQQRLINEVENDHNELAANGDNSSKLSLSDEDILCSALFLLVVGLETTGTLLANCTYALAFHPEVQQKLYEEVAKICELDESKSNHKFDYEALTSCQYLDAVISETLRSNCPVLLMDRVASEDYHVAKYNVTIPKGSKVFLAYHAIMNDPEYWQKPEEFNPERFMPAERDKIVPGSYCPFGAGPRHCLGMRFSLTEAKLGLAKVIMKYQFEAAPNTVYPPTPKNGMGLNSIKKPLVTVRARKG